MRPILRQDTVGKGSDDVWYMCDSQTWRTATDIEKDTATWGTGKFDGEVRSGLVNMSIYYIYEANNKAWRNARTLEKDTYDYKNNKAWANGTDGEIKKGSVTDTIYVFDATTWRVADDIEKVLGGCVAAIQDSVAKLNNTYYICSPRKWVTTTALQYDTHNQKCTEFGQILHGDYTYFCYGKEWRRFYGNDSIVYGKLVDERDEHVYRTVKIGDQIWMAENLSYIDSIMPSTCLDDHDSCALFGRYYSWGTAIDYVFWAKQGKQCKDINERCGGLPEKVQGICPNGWRLPTGDDWNTLFAIMGNDYKAMQAQGFEQWKKATDKYGFSALPAGQPLTFEFSGVGSVANFWSATQHEKYAQYAYHWYLITDEAGINYQGVFSRNAQYSVRCIKDEE